MSESEGQGLTKAAIRAVIEERINDPIHFIDFSDPDRDSRLKEALVWAFVIGVWGYLGFGSGHGSEWGTVWSVLAGIAFMLGIVAGGGISWGAFLGMAIALLLP